MGQLSLVDFSFPLQTPQASERMVKGVNNRFPPLFSALPLLPPLHRHTGGKNPFHNTKC